MYLCNLINHATQSICKYRGAGIAVTPVQDNIDEIRQIQSDISNLEQNERGIDEQIEALKNNIDQMISNQDYQRHNYVTYRDILSIPSLRDRTVLAIRAPSGTMLTVPDPDEGMTYPMRRYQIHLKSPSQPIKVYLLTHEEAEGNGGGGGGGGASSSTTTTTTNSGRDGSEATTATSVVVATDIASTHLDHHYQQQQQQQQQLHAQQQLYHDMLAMVNSHHHHHHHHHESGNSSGGISTMTTTNNATSMLQADVHHHHHTHHHDHDHDLTYHHHLHVDPTSGSTYDNSPLRSNVFGDDDDTDAVTLSPPVTDQDFVYGMESHEGISDIFS